MSHFNVQAYPTDILTSKGDDLIQQTKGICEKPGTNIVLEDDWLKAFT